ncbi:MAG: GDP-mannose 4,6-dehydratase, partial [Patescibacteria group bacterium]|nr:GDP-mannose 4,6-dehydratase [Patescibacteria group bacterium]
MKTILITGGAGFIGSYLCEKYFKEGNKIICLDNLQTTGSTKNIEEMLRDKNFKFIKHDIIEPIKFKEKIDWIFNLACSGSPTSYQYDPIHTTKTNTIGAINMLELARRHGARIMQFSTSEVYGDPLTPTQSETYNGNVNPLGPRACYDEGKRCAETLFMDYYREYGVDIKIIRIFNTYGPKMDINDGRAMTNFIVNALAGKDMVIYGDGSYTRSFQYIDDLINGIDLMMNQENFTGPVNLGNPEEISIFDLAKKIIEKTKSKSKITMQEKPTDDP